VLQKPSDNDVSTAGSRKGLFYGGCRGVLYAFCAVGETWGPENPGPLRPAVVLAARPLSVGRIEVEALIEHRAGSAKAG
jgi:hypothetical protein